jgi:hypothetical protein
LANTALPPSAVDASVGLGLDVGAVVGMADIARWMDSNAEQRNTRATQLKQPKFASVDSSIEIQWIWIIQYTGCHKINNI